MTSVAIMSRKPRTALVGGSAGELRGSGTPKNARKYRLAESSSISRSVMAVIVPPGPAVTRGATECVT